MKLSCLIYSVLISGSVIIVPVLSSNTNDSTEIQVAVPVASAATLRALESKRLQAEELSDRLTNQLRKALYSPANLTDESTGRIRAAFKREHFQEYVELNMLRIELEDLENQVREQERDSELRRLHQELQIALQQAQTEEEKRRLRSEYKVIREIYQLEVTSIRRESRETATKASAQ